MSHSWKRVGIVLKLLHTADVHLGARFIGLGDKGLAQRQQVRASFKKLISLAIEESVDVVLIAGDLFDSNCQPQTNIDLVVEQFARLAAANIPVSVIPGTHDCFDSASIYQKVNLEAKCPGLTVFTAEDWECREFPSLNLTIYGKPNLSNRSYKSPLDGLGRSTKSQYHVAMAHGSLNIGTIAADDHVFTAGQIAASRMHYIALGHWHDPYACSDREVVAWYSGSPELISMNKREPGSVLIVTIHDSGQVEVEKRLTGLRACDELEIDISGYEDLASLRARIVTGADRNLVREVVLKGLKNEDIFLSLEELESDLSDCFFFLRINDQSHPRIDELADEFYQNKLVLGRFIRLMKEHIEACQGEEREIAEEALQYGLALLQGKEVF